MRQLSPGKVGKQLLTSKQTPNAYPKTEPDGSDPHLNDDEDLFEVQSLGPIKWSCGSMNLWGGHTATFSWVRVLVHMHEPPHSWEGSRCGRGLNACEGAL